MDSLAAPLGSSHGQTLWMVTGGVEDESSTQCVSLFAYCDVFHLDLMRQGKDKARFHERAVS